MGRFLTLALTAFLCACCASAPKARIFEARPLEPEGWYETVYNDARACVELDRQPRKGATYDRIEWYLVPADAIPGIAGMFSMPNRIYLDARYVVNERVVRHELVHYLLGVRGDPHHQATFVRCINEAP